MRLASSKVRIGSILASVAVAIACSSDPETRPVEPGPSSDDAELDVVDRVFLSIRILENGAPKELMDGTQLRLEFEHDEFSTAGRCRSVFGRYRIEDGVLRIRADESRVPCGERQWAQDDWYFDFIGSKPRVEARPGGLSLSKGGIVIDFRDQRAMPTNPIVDSAWTVVSARNADIDVRADLEEPATLVFDDDDRVDIFDGCKPSRGDYSVQGRRLDFARVRGADGKCEGDEAALARAVKQVIYADDLYWEHLNGRLTLTGRGSTLVLSKTKEER